MTTDTNAQDQTSPEAIADEDLNHATAGFGGRIYLKGKHLPPDLAIADSYELVAGKEYGTDGTASMATRSSKVRKT